MAYNKRNFYRKVAEIQDVALQNQRRYVTQKELYHKEIENVYHISLRTFRSYLEIPAKLKLAKMDKRHADAVRHRQLKIEF